MCNSRLRERSLESKQSHTGLIIIYELHKKLCTPQYPISLSIKGFHDPLKHVPLILYYYVFCVFSLLMKPTLKLITTISYPFHYHCRPPHSPVRKRFFLQTLRSFICCSNSSISTPGSFLATSFPEQSLIQLSSSISASWNCPRRSRAFSKSCCLATLRDWSSFQAN